MFFIRQNATHKVVLGPAVAVGDGFTPITTLALTSADEAEVILHDNGTIVAINAYTWAAITTADGYYHLTLQTGITSTIGHMTVVVNDDSLCLPLRADFTIVEEAVYDQFYASAAAGALQPTTAGRTLDVTATGAAGIDWGNVENPTTAVDLSATDIQLADTVTTYTGNTKQTGDSFLRIGAAGASLTDLGGMATAMKAEVLAEVNTALDAAISELAQAIPSATPSIRNAVMLMYMALRNQLIVQTSGTDAIQIYNDAGTMIAKKLITDSAGDYTEAEAVAGT